MKERVKELAKNLPLNLRAGLNEDVLQAAIEQQMLTVHEDGHWEWLLESKTLLAYFCGRMWCGDTSSYSRKVRARIWVKSVATFPEKDLRALFGVKNLRELRKKRDLHALPLGWQLVERIFKGNGK